MKKIFCSVIVAVALLAGGCATDEIVERRYLASERHRTEIFAYDEQQQTMLVCADTVRGVEVQAVVNRTKKHDDQLYVEVRLGKERRYVRAESLVTDRGEVVAEKQIFVRTPASIITDTETSAIGGLADKGAMVEVIGYDSIDSRTGAVNRYRVRLGSVEGHLYGKYTVFKREEAMKRYMAERYDPIHSAVKNPFGGGEAIGCDFYPTEKVSFPDNKMPRSCYSLYLNISPAVIGNIERYIAFAKRTKINTFVIDIKDNECPGYKADAMEKYSPTNHRYAGKNKEEMYKKAVMRLHEEGFYVVGRITCFKDSHFVKDHPEVAITEIATGKPFKHNKAYWPSPYDRKVWHFNVELAKEAVRKFGFNEINFDYVRFPDRLTRIEKENIVDFHNKYKESKVQAIQRFVQYACDEIHAVGAYVSIDVFGEAANPGYTTAYGQYWPAISNVCDAICGMPYPDHFSNNYYGVKQPWNHPYEILKAWGERVQARQAVTPTPAAVRTWIQAYPVMRHVDKNGLRYDAEDVEKEIRGLYAAGLTGGYTTWHSGSNLEKYKAQKAAFCIDYLKEWKKSNNKK